MKSSPTEYRKINCSFLSILLPFLWDDTKSPSKHFLTFWRPPVLATGGFFLPPHSSSKRHKQAPHPINDQQKTKTHSNTTASNTTQCSTGSGHDKSRARKTAQYINHVNRKSKAVSCTSEKDYATIKYRL